MDARDIVSCGGIWGEFGGGVWAAKQTTTTAKATAIDQSLRLRLHSGLRQSGGRIAAVLDAGLKPRSTSEAKAKRFLRGVEMICPGVGWGTTIWGMGGGKRFARSANTPPFAKARRMGHPALGSLRSPLDT